jgi:hypothetical protein
MTSVASRGGVGTGGVDVVVVGTEGVDAVELDMRTTLADAAVAPFAFAPVELVEVAVHADQEHVEPLQQRGQLVAPGGELDDVLDDQIVAGGGEGGDAAMEAVEERRPQAGPPGERTVGLAAVGQHPHHVVGRQVEERLVEPHLDGSGQRRLARAGRSVQEDDPARHRAHSRNRFPAEPRTCVRINQLRSAPWTRSKSWSIR